LQNIQKVIPMPVIDAARFQAEARRINPNMGRIKKSSLDPIFKLLGDHPRTTLAPQLHDQIQELIHFLPFETHQKYAAALQVLEQGGLKICGRPVSPTMHFARFDEGTYAYVGKTHDGQDKLVNLSPGSLHHVFDFKWKSSTGNMQSLATVWTREHVRFRTPQRNPPFNDVNPPDMEFYWGETTGATAGFGRDDHSTKPPVLICRYPWVTGACIAEQWYQYSLDGQTWKNIPEAAYLLHKGVRQSKGVWVFYFRKCNWAPHNPVGFNFEAEYPLGAPISHPPKAGQSFMRNNGSEAQIADFGRLVSRR